MSIKVSKEVLVGLAWDEHDGSVFDVASQEDYDESRWEMIVRQVLEHKETGKFYETFYRRGLTECQESEPYEYEDDEIELEEVFEKEIKTVIYVKSL